MRTARLLHPRRIRLALLLSFLALPAAAQSVTVGSQSMAGSIAYSFNPPYTLIDLSHPATADGTLNFASVLWTGTATGCAGAFKVKFLHPSSAVTIGTFTLVAERGPFTAQPGRNQVALTPPVTVAKGDLIAVTALVGHAACGSPASWSESNAASSDLAGDVSSGSFNGAFYFRDTALAARATDTQQVLEGVVTAAGSLQGNFGSFFRTALQIACPGGGTCTGQLVFHPAGVPASPSDQALPYTVSSAAGAAYADVVQYMGKSGLGTLDVISNNGFPPLVTARVYNDQGASGTSGFTEEMIRTTDVLHPGDIGILLTPSDLTNYRVNIGVRTLSADATVAVQYGFHGQSSKDFPANEFQQFSLAGFGDTAPVPNEQIFFFVQSGDVVIYQSITDNKTNDSAVEFARRR